MSTVLAERSRERCEACGDSDKMEKDNYEQQSGEYSENQRCSCLEDSMF